MQRILTSFYLVFGTLLGALILAITLLLVIDAGGRFLANAPLLGGVEISKILLSCVVFGSYSYALFQGAHVRVTVFTRIMSAKCQQIGDILVCILGIAFLGFLTYCSWEQFWASWLVRETMRAPIHLPRWLIKLALTCGCFLFAAQFAFQLLSDILKLTGRKGD